MSKIATMISPSFLTSFFLLFSCNVNSCDSNESIENLELDVKFLESRVKSLEEELGKRLDEYLELSDNVILLANKEESKALAFFRISPDGICDKIQVVESSLGRFLVSLKSVTPYLFGYKLVFTIGNPSFATYYNTKLKVTWNRSFTSWRDDKDHAAKIEEYLKTHKECLSKLTSNEDGIKWPELPKRPFWSDEKKKKEFTLSSINPGSWNTIEVHLTPATLEQLGQVKVSIETTSVRLQNG